ncbi:hypothetical protein PVL29_027148 [Vitis rotundifolia]|uniref:Uncharacterized protein n=1 Tax=Vitis rotundifolia TaxID=103349 RepID=A0AA38YIG0_VITRO|nr:hypothetical protein PVL29_027148 [Vitis rotundifolia]
MKPHLQRFQHCGIENGFNEIPWLGGFNRVNASDPYLETVGVVGSHLTKFRAESHDAADKNAWGSIDQQPCRVGSYCSKTRVRKLMHEWLGDDRMSQKIKPKISDRLGSLILKLTLNVDEFNNSLEALLEKDEMSAAFHKLILMEKCRSWRIRFIAGLFSHSSKADEPSLSIRDSEMLLIYPNIKIRPTFNQPWYLMRLPSGMLKKHAILFPKESYFSSGGLPDVECLLDNPVHRDPFDPYMLDDTARDLSGLANNVEHLFRAKPISYQNSKELPDVLKVLDTFSQFVSEMKNEQHDAKVFAFMLRAMMEKFERDIKESKFVELMNKHSAASAIPKVAVNSAVQSSLQPEKIVFHVITDKKTYAGMHS